MAKITYNNIQFDSELEVNYYKHLINLGIEFMYHHNNRIELDFMKKGYTIDFIEIHHNEKVIMLTETKGWNQFSYRTDEMIHSAMKRLVKSDDGIQFLRDWLDSENIGYQDYKICYQKIKYNKKEGFVDWSFKPKGMKEHWKEKYFELEEEYKSLQKELKDVKRYFSYINKDKLTKSQREWLYEFEKKYIKGD